MSPHCHHLLRHQVISHWHSNAFGRPHRSNLVQEHGRACRGFADEGAGSSVGAAPVASASAGVDGNEEGQTDPTWMDQGFAEFADCSIFPKLVNHVREYKTPPTHIGS